VDPVARRRFWDALYRLSRDAGVTILITTHYMDEAEQCDRIALLYGGRVVGLGRPADLKPMVVELWGRLFEVQCEDPERAMAILGAHFPGVIRFGRSLRLFSRDPAASQAIRRLLGTGAGSIRVRERPVSLEEVFSYFVEEGIRRDRAAHRHS
jgi:ABC-2 type transport system ATP-binding protein